MKPKRQKTSPIKPARTTLEQYNKEIEEAEAQIKAGFFTTHEEVLKGLEKLLKK